LSFESQRIEIINIAKKLLEEKTVKSLLAFAPGQLDGSGVPIFIRSAEELDNIKWDDTCSANLAKYLTERKEKVAIVAKPCDARAIVMYMVEKQIARDNVYIIGVECQGMTDKDGNPAPGCGECDVRIPPIYDVLLKNPDDVDRRNGYVHLYGVGMFAALIAIKRGVDPELAEIAGILHDYISYKEPHTADHAHRCAPVVRELLFEINITTAEETEMICSAIYNHSDKDSVNSTFDEIIKDADVMQHWLRNPKEPIFREGDRIEKLRQEFGLIANCSG
jgi:hypothetical protein